MTAGGCLDFAGRRVGAAVARSAAGMLASSPAFRYAGNRGEASGAWRRAMPADAGHPMLASLAGWISSLRLLIGHRTANGQRPIHGRRVVGFWLAPVVDFLLAPKQLLFGLVRALGFGGVGLGRLLHPWPRGGLDDLGAPFSRGEVTVQHDVGIFVAQFAELQADQQLAARAEMQAMRQRLDDLLMAVAG